MSSPSSIFPNATTDSQPQPKPPPGPRTVEEQILDEEMAKYHDDESERGGRRNWKRWLRCRSGPQSGGGVCGSQGGLLFCLGCCMFC